MVLKYYFDLMSQPSRALFIFFKLAGIPFEPCVVSLAKAVHLTDDFKRNLNKFQKVPFIHHNEFKLAESIAIVRYVTREFQVDDHWYPKDSQRQAELDEFLEWQHLNLRLFCASYFQQKWLIPKMKGNEPDNTKVQFFYKEMLKSLKTFEECFLYKDGFINGNNKVSYADIAAACEIEQTRVAGYDAEDNFPRIKVWMEEVRRECNPHYDEAHVLINKLANISKKKLEEKL